MGEVEGRFVEAVVQLLDGGMLLLVENGADTEEMRFVYRCGGVGRLWLCYGGGGGGGCCSEEELAVVVGEQGFERYV